MPTDPTDAITPERIDQLYQTVIRPTVFADSPSGEPTPTLILLGGQAGSGKSRASARLLAEYDRMVAVSGDDLRAFHPGYRELVADQPERAGPILAEATRPWVRAIIQECLDERHSLLLEGSFGDPDTTLSTATRFRDAGFNVRIVAIASPRVLSLVTAASRYFRDLKAGEPARFTSLGAHDYGFDGTTRLIEVLEPTLAVDRVTIIGRGGIALFDQSSGASDGAIPFNDAGDALHAGRHPDSWGARSTMELLGELKQVTRFAIESSHLTRDAAELLVEAHTAALNEVIPRLGVDSDSPQAKFIQQAVSDQLVVLRRAALPAQTPTPDLAPALGAQTPDLD